MGDRNRRKRTKITARYGDVVTADGITIRLSRRKGCLGGRLMLDIRHPVDVPVELIKRDIDAANAVNDTSDTADPAD